MPTNPTPTTSLNNNSSLGSTTPKMNITGSTGSLGTTPKTNTSLQPKLDKPLPPLNKPKEPSTNIFDNFNLGGVGLSNFGLDPTTAQGFATWASFLRPVTEAVSRFGGLPALMAIYGLVSGSKDYQLATTKQNPATNTQNNTLPTSNQQVERLPMPVETPAGLGMPDLNNNFYTKYRTITEKTSAELPTSKSSINDLLKRPDWNAPYKIQPRKPINYINPSTTILPAKPPSDEQQPVIPQRGFSGKYLAKELGKGYLEWEASRQALPRLLGSKPNIIQAMARNKAPIPLTGLLRANTLAGATSDLLDVAGLYNTDRDRLTAWQKPKYDAKGNQILDEFGRPDWKLGWNPGAIGNYNTRAFDQRTTPDEHGGLFGILPSGYRPIDFTTGYLGATLQTTPFKAAPVMVKELAWGSNPAVQYAFNPREREGWSRAYSGKPIDLHNSDVSTPLIFADAWNRQSWRPNVKGKIKELESDRWKRMQGSQAYHPDYNPQGTGKSNQLPHAKEWLWSPVKQTRNFKTSVKDKGFLNTMRDAWLHNW